jgi:hypothetical protein
MYVHGSLVLGSASSERSLKNVPSVIGEMESCTIKGMPKPTVSPKFKDFKPGDQSQVIDTYDMQDAAWLITGCFQRSLERTTASKVDDVADDEPVHDHLKDKRPAFLPWAGYNSVVTTDTRPCTNVQVLPRIQAPANEWQTLVTVLKQTQHISAEVVGPERKTIITLDMDLYMRAVRLQQLRKDCIDKWILRLGKFHVVLCALRICALGSVVENSGIDDAWVESGLYGSTTVTHIRSKAHQTGS